MVTLSGAVLVNRSTDSTASTTCAGGTEVIRALIDQLAQGLQKWVGWQEGDTCCLGQTKGGNSEGIGKGCERSGANCCGNGNNSHECSTKCGTGANGGTANKCYHSAYCKSTTQPSSSSAPTDLFLWTSISSDSEKVHLLARIFLGSVCLIWSGLSQLGFLTGGTERWSKSSLHEESDGLGSFMAAMGYDLERLNKRSGYHVWKLLSGEKEGVSWLEFQGGSTSQDSVAEYYSSIYGNAKTAVGKMAEGKRTEQVCEKYPLLVLHILASGYFRAGSAGAKGIIPAKPASSTSQSTDSTSKKPRTIREILYWLSALPYSQAYKDLVERMQQKYPPKEGEPEKTVDDIKLYDDKQSNSASTTLQRKDITHYLMAACGYCPLVLIGIQGTIEREVTQPQPAVPGVPGAVSPAAAAKNTCPKHKKNPHKRCDPKDIKTPAPAAGSTGELEKGEVCYGGYHLAVKQFGPLHGMYANGLFGFQMETSPAQCLDQLRIYVYHCFYQLYFLRKQCSAVAVLGWKSCRYGSGVYWGSGANSLHSWVCKAEGNAGDHTKNCGKSDGGGSTVSDKLSPLMCFLCDGVDGMHCKETKGKSNSERNPYPDIEEHMNTKDDFPKGHLEMPQGHCPVPMGWQSPSSSGSSAKNENHFKDLSQGTHKTEKLQQQGQDQKTYPAHCTGNTLSLLLEYYCDPEKQHGTLVLVLRLLACITPTVPRTLGDLFGFYYYIVYIGGKSASGGGVEGEVKKKLKGFESSVRLGMIGIGGGTDVVEALEKYGKGCSSGKEGYLKCLTDCDNGTSAKYLSPLSGQQYGQLSPLMAGTYLSWLVYLIGEFQKGLEGLAKDYMNIQCKLDGCNSGQGGVAGAAGCGELKCHKGFHGTKCDSSSDGVCKCPSVVSCTGVLPVLYKYGFGYGNVTELHNGKGPENKKCHHFLGTLENVLKGEHLKKDGSSGNLHHEINQLIYTTRLPWIFVLTLAWLVAVLYLAFGAIWPLDWTHMRSHCRGWFRKGSLRPWEILMVGKKKGSGILEFFGGT